MLFQACRGRKYDWGVDLPPPDEDAVDAGEPVQKIPLEADVLKAYSVCPGRDTFVNWLELDPISAMIFHHNSNSVVISVGSHPQWQDCCQMHQRNLCSAISQCLDDLKWHSKESFIGSLQSSHVITPLTFSKILTKHSIAHPWGWAMGHLLRVQCLTGVPPYLILYAISMA